VSVPWRRRITVLRLTPALFAISPSDACGFFATTLAALAPAGLPQLHGIDEGATPFDARRGRESGTRLTPFSFFQGWRHRMNMGGPTTKQEECVENAVESLELAERLASSSDRRRTGALA
jgi:hypothetical protein